MSKKSPTGIDERTSSDNEIEELLSTINDSEAFGLLNIVKDLTEPAVELTKLLVTVEKDRGNHLDSDKVLALFEQSMSAVGYGATQLVRDFAELSEAFEEA